MFFRSKQKKEMFLKVKKELAGVPKERIREWLKPHEGFDDDDSKDLLMNSAFFDYKMTLAVAKRLKNKLGIKCTGKKPNENRIIKFLNEFKHSKNVISESKLKFELYTKLKELFDQQFVRKESGNNCVDLVLDGYIPVELKYNFGKSGLDRLIGQINKYELDKTYKKSKVIIVYIYKLKNDDGYAELKERTRKFRRLKIILKK